MVIRITNVVECYKVKKKYFFQKATEKGNKDDCVQKQRNYSKIYEKRVKIHEKEREKKKLNFSVIRLMSQTHSLTHSRRHV